MNTLYDFDTIAPYDPLLSRIYPDGRPMTDAEVLEIWKSLRDVSEEVYLLLSSRLIAEKMRQMMQTLQLSESVSMRIVSLLRMYYFGKAPFEQFPLLLKNDVGLPQEKTAAVMNFIRTEIVPLRAPRQSEESDDIAPKANMMSLQLLQALEKFSRINDQQVTGERIRVRSEKEMVRGTVRNWLRAYRDIVGARQHTAMERGQFLFQADNTKNLSSQERDKVGLILKSLDDGELLAVNPEKQEIVFPVDLPSVQRQVPVSPSLQRPVASQSPLQSSIAQPSMQRAPQQQAPQSTLSRPRMQAAIPTMKPFNFSRTAQTAQVPSALPIADDASAPDPFRFSSGHTLPAEKQASIDRPAQAPAQKKEVWQVPAALQNIVDLRSDE